MRRGFWEWMKEDHPVMNEVVWWGTVLIATAALAISIYCIIRS